MESTIKKTIILIIIIVFYSSFFISAQTKKIDYYSIGYNDALNRNKFDSKYLIEKLSDSLKKITDEDDKIQFVKDTQAYNLGYSAGICEKQGLDYTDIYPIILEYFDDIENYFSNNSKEVFNPGVSAEEYQSQRIVLNWYKNIGVIQTTTSDKNPATVRVNVFLGYKSDETATEAEIKSRTVEIKDYLRRYFRGKSKAELTNPNNEEKLKTEIRNSINDLILSSSKIRDVSFEQLDVIE